MQKKNVAFSYFYFYFLFFVNKKWFVQRKHLCIPPHSSLYNVGRTVAQFKTVYHTLQIHILHQKEKNICVSHNCKPQWSNFTAFFFFRPRDCLCSWYQKIFAFCWIRIVLMCLCLTHERFRLALFCNNWSICTLIVAQDFKTVSLRQMVYVFENCIFDVDARCRSESQFKYWYSIVCRRHLGI